MLTGTLLILLTRLPLNVASVSLTIGSLLMALIRKGCLDPQALEPLQEQRSVISQRLRLEFPETWHNRSDEQAIRSEQDLLNFCDQSLEWLCTVSRTPGIRRGTPEQTGQQVAERVEKLRSSIPMSLTIQWNLDATKRFLRRVAQNI